MRGEPDAATFYADRNRRTGQYVGDEEMPVSPVAVVVGTDAAETMAGQLATLALVNMLARVHRTLIVDLPDAPLVVRSPLGAATTLRAAALRTAIAIDPYVHLVESSRRDGIPTVGIGAHAPGGLDGYLFINGWTGGIGTSSSSVGNGGESALGAGMAACMGAAFLFQRARGRFPTPHTVSLWHLAEGEADPGPIVSWPLSVGDVMVIGAGAVGSGLAYWLSHTGVLSSWTFVDHDVARIHNTNRSLGMTATNAGWPGSPRDNKAAVAAGLLGEHGYPHIGTYVDWLSSHPENRPDLVIPLANEHGIRRAVMARGEPILIHGSTSANWTAELHRHRPDIDDCIPCRLPDDVHTRFQCSAGPADPGDTSESGDAALPFLSGAAGLLVLAGLTQVQLGGLIGQPRNHWRIHMDLGHRALSSSLWSCRSGCTSVLPRDVRSAVQSGGRWDSLDLAPSAPA